MSSSRVRLGLLWISQVARVMADWGVRITAFQQLRSLGGPHRDSAWHLVTAVFIAPFILLAPFNGCLSNSLPRRWVLVAAGILSLAAVAAFLPAGPWLWALGVMALGSAVHSAARYAMLPAAAHDSHLPLPRVNGWIELGAVSAIVGGIIVGLLVPDETDGIRNAILVVLALSALAVLTALPSAFPSDHRRPEAPGQAVLGFFRDCRRVFADNEARYSLIALAAFQGIVTAGSGAAFTQALNNLGGEEAVGNEAGLLALILVCAGLAVGAGLAAMQGNIRRGLGLVPLGLTGLVIAQAWTALSNDAGIAPAVPSFLLGMMGGLVNVPLRTTYLGSVPADARGNATAVMNFVIYGLTTVIAFGMFLLVQGGLLADTQAQLWFLTGVLATVAVLSWRLLLAHVLEMFVEWLLLPMHRLRYHGPGVDKIPVRGPLIILGNHASWFDPFWVAKVSPRYIRPMMTAKFYDVPLIHWLMKNVVRAIRVPMPTFRREAPELGLAKEELRNGGCLVLFPEGMMRRTEERVLRQFGRGIWHILREHPQTPVVVLWIEGGWGCCASYWNGPPMKNKRLDFRRPIDIAVEEAQVLPPEVLADHRTTRQYLMRACLEARRHLGLPVFETPLVDPEAQEEAEPEAATG